MSLAPNPVPKPSPAGSPLLAIANTRMAFAKIRMVPGTRYRTIANLRHHALVIYFPTTRTSDGWLWVEEGASAGWVSTQVVSFDEIHTPVPAPLPGGIETPFDRQVGLWHERGAALAYADADEFAADLQRQAPNLTQIYLKVCDWTPNAGAQWMGYWDTRRGLAVGNAAAVDDWVDALTDYGLSLVVWATPHGGDPGGEAALLAQAAERDGVTAVILDLQPYRSLWSAEPTRIEAYTSALREHLGSSVHVGVSFPFGTPFETLWLERWLPLANSLHPHFRWTHLRSAPAPVLTRAKNLLTAFSLPVIATLQADANALEMTEAQTLAIYRLGARGISWRRTGAIHPGSIQPVVWDGLATLPVSVARGQSALADVIVIKPDNPDCVIRAAPESLPVPFPHSWGWSSLVTTTQPWIARVRAAWTPRLPVSGIYEIAAFIPARHAQVPDASYSIKTADGERTVVLDQGAARGEWVTLAAVPLDADMPGCGQVVLSSLSDVGGQLAIDAIRWRRVVEGASVFVADGFDMPVGTATERKSRKVWGGEWTDSAPFGKLSFVGTADESYHTGADLNPPPGIDPPFPVYSAASGVVTFAASVLMWGGLVVIRHDPLDRDGMILMARYAHLVNLRVTVGERVKRGQPIGDIDTASFRVNPTLHFDLSPTPLLSYHPVHWAGTDRDQVFKQYLDPREFIEANRPV